ncbi:hypothetical protein B0H10DRAFT_1370284 [Mycena sp. CBHHK59/15]|nr:hypothetical protein B0H10DRAFT_1370284 [Mycena sp. CBHHK59/15]
MRSEYYATSESEYRSTDTSTNGSIQESRRSYSSTVSQPPAPVAPHIFTRYLQPKSSLTKWKYVPSKKRRASESNERHNGCYTPGAPPMSDARYPIPPRTAYPFPNGVPTATSLRPIPSKIPGVCVAPPLVRAPTQSTDVTSTLATSKSDTPAVTNSVDSPRPQRSTPTALAPSPSNFTDIFGLPLANPSSTVSSAPSTRALRSKDRYTPIPGIGKAAGRTAQKFYPPVPSLPSSLPTAIDHATGPVAMCVPVIQCENPTPPIGKGKDCTVDTFFPLVPAPPAVDPSTARSVQSTPDPELEGRIPRAAKGKGRVLDNFRPLHPSPLRQSDTPLVDDDAMELVPRADQGKGWATDDSRASTTPDFSPGKGMDTDLDIAFGRPLTGVLGVVDVSPSVARQLLTHVSFMTDAEYYAKLGQCAVSRRPFNFDFPMSVD